MITHGPTFKQSFTSGETAGVDPIGERGETGNIRIKIQVMISTWVGGEEARTGKDSLAGNISSSRGVYLKGYIEYVQFYGSITRERTGQKVATRKRVDHLPS